MSRLSLKNFIFNPDSWLFLGNNNDPAPVNFYDPPGTIYNFVLEVEGVDSDQLEKFKTIPDNRRDLEEAVTRAVNNHPLCDYRMTPSERQRYSFSYGDGKVYGGGNIDSLARFDEGYVTVFKTKYIHSKNGMDYLGVEVLDSKDLKFEFKKI